VSSLGKHIQNLTSFSVMSKKGEVEAKRANHKNKKVQICAMPN
jgi:hypothetical protein